MTRSKPKDRPGFEWQYHEGCNCKACPWKGHCRGEDWPHWKEAVKPPGGAS